MGLGSVMHKLYKCLYVLPSEFLRSEFLRTIKQATGFAEKVA